jgi:uncharacterized protein YxjI
MFRRHDREQQGAQGAPGVYRIREKLFSIGDDFWIDRGDQPVFKVDGKALRIRDTLVIEDLQGREVAAIKKKLVAVRDTMTIERAGQTVATVKKAMVSPLRERFTVEVAGGADYDVQGKITDHSYTFERGGSRVAEVSKKWFAVRDTYGVEIGPGQDDGLILAAVVAIDQMTHDVG